MAVGREAAGLGDDPVRGPGRRRSAAPTALNHITVVLSPTTTWPGAAPSSGAIRSPTVTGRSHQPRSFQPPMRSRVPLVAHDARRARRPCPAPAARASCRRGRSAAGRGHGRGIVGSPPVTDVGGEVRLGSMLFTLVEPHRGHEVAYNRWYERDHFYAGCMVGPWLFAGRRFVATRALKDLRFGSDADLFGGVDLGSYLAVYWILEGRHDDHVDWALRQVQWLHANGRMFGERDHIHTLLYRHEWTARGAGNGAVPAELALDHPFGGLTATLVRPGRRRDRVGGRRLRPRPLLARARARLLAHPAAAGRAGEPAGPRPPRRLPAQPLASRPRRPTRGGTSSEPPPTRSRPTASARCSGRRRSSRRSRAPTPTPTSCGERLRAAALAGPPRVARAAEPHRAEPDGDEPRRARRHRRRRAGGVVRGTGARRRRPAHRRVGRGGLPGRVHRRAPDRGVRRRAPPGPAAPGRRRPPPRRRRSPPSSCTTAPRACSTSPRADRCSCRRRSGRRRPTRSRACSRAEESAAVMAPFASPNAAYSVKVATDDDLAWVVDRFVDAATRAPAGRLRRHRAARRPRLPPALVPHAEQQPARRPLGRLGRGARRAARRGRAGGAGRRRPDVPAVGAHRRVRGAPRSRARRIEDSLVAMGLAVDAGLDAIHVTAYGEPMVATGITDGHTPARARRAAALRRRRCGASSACR